MKIQIVSDIHISHWKRYLGKPLAECVDLLVPETDADVLVVAGDFGHGPRDMSLVLRQLMRRQSRVVFVEGNHDRYGEILGADLPHPRKCWNLIYSSLRVGVVKFAGATLWHTDSAEAKRRAPQISDYYEIKGWHEGVGEENLSDRAWLASQVTTDGVMVTHHLPLWESVAPKYANDPNNCLFVSDMSELIKERRPALVIHGHTHAASDYMFGPTRVVCNPIGYPGENYTKHNMPTPNVVELETAAT
jgi:predicted phosphodiesterase